VNPEEVGKPSQAALDMVRRLNEPEATSASDPWATSASDPWATSTSDSWATNVEPSAAEAGGAEDSEQQAR
jgi:hypothetical protein